MRQPPSHQERLYPIADVAEITGISADVLRIWEARYGWPMPQRRANGFRGYPPGLVITLTRVGALIQRGRTIGDILRDPSLDVTNQSPAVGSRVVQQPRDFSHIPEPESPLGKDIRRALEQAIAVNDRGTIARLTAESQRLKPEERERACAALLRDR